MKFSKTLAVITAAAMAFSSLAVMASAEEATPEEVKPGFAGFFIQNNGGDWAWFASEDESTDLDVTGEYDVVWSDVQSVITKTAGDLSLSLLKAPAESWESYPSIGIQVGSSFIVEPDQAGKVDALVADIVITLTDGTEVTLEDMEAKGDLLGKQEDWGISGNNVMVKFDEAIKTKLELDDEGYFAWLKTVASMSAKLTVNELLPAEDFATEDEGGLGDSEEVPGDSEDVADEPETEGTVALELANGGRTVVDSGLVRTNIINAWTGDEADVLLDKEAFAGANLVSVKFTVTGVTEAFDAWLSFADKSWAVQYWGKDHKDNALADCTVVTIDKDGTYVVTATLEQAIEAMEFIAVCTNLEVEGEVSPITITIDELKIDVAEIEDPEAPGESSGEPTNPDTGVVLVVVPAALAAAALATSGIVLKKRSK